MDRCQDLRYIKSVLHISVEELSIILGIQEQRVLNILNNQESGIDIVDKINHLLNIATEYRNMHIDKVDILTSQPVYNGKNLSELLNYKYSKQRDKFYLFDENIY